MGAPYVSIILLEPFVDVLDVFAPTREPGEGEDDGAGLHTQHLCQMTPMKLHHFH